MKISNINFNNNYMQKVNSNSNSNYKTLAHIAYSAPNYEHYSYLNAACNLAFGAAENPVNADAYLDEILAGNAYVMYDGKTHMDFALKSEPDKPIEQVFTYSKIMGALNRNPDIAKKLFQDDFYDGDVLVQTIRTDVIKRMFNFLNDENIKNLVGVFDFNGDNKFIGGDLAHFTTIPRLHLLIDKFSVSDRDFLSKMLSTTNLMHDVKSLPNSKKLMSPLVEEFKIINNYLKGDTLVDFYKRRDEDGKTYLELAPPVLRAAILNNLMEKPTEFAKILEIPFSDGSTFLHNAPQSALRSITDLYLNDPRTLAKLYLKKDAQGRNILETNDFETKCRIMRPYIGKVYNSGELMPAEEFEMYRLLKFASKNAKKYKKQ